MYAGLFGRVGLLECLMVEGCGVRIECAGEGGEWIAGCGCVAAFIE